MRIESQARALEFLQNFSFMLWEVPNLSLSRNAGVTYKDLLPVLLPVFGFSSISSPEVTASVEEINVGNRNSPYKYIANWAYGAITLSRGSSLTRVDIAAWVQEVIKGSAIRRNFILTHYTRSIPPGVNDLPLAFAKLFTIPAKMWLLEGCYPIRYKAASDFDASSGDISIEELDLDPLRIVDYSATGVNALKSLLPA